MIFNQNSDKRDLSFAIGKTLRNENMIAIGVIVDIEVVVDGYGHESIDILFENADGEIERMDARNIGHSTPNTRSLTITRNTDIQIASDREYISFPEIKEEDRVNHFAYKPCWKPKRQRKSDFMDGVTEVITIGG